MGAGHPTTNNWSSSLVSAHQLAVTPTPLLEDFGFCGDTLDADDLLEGRYDYEKVHDPAVRLLLQHLVQIQSLVEKITLPTITMGEFRSKLKV